MVSCPLSPQLLPTGGPQLFRLQPTQSTHASPPCRPRTVKQCACEQPCDNLQASERTLLGERSGAAGLLLPQGWDRTGQAGRQAVETDTRTLPPQQAFLSCCLGGL